MATEVRSMPQGRTLRLLGAYKRPPKAEGPPGTTVVSAH